MTLTPPRIIALCLVLLGGGLAVTWQPKDPPPSPFLQASVRTSAVTEAAYVRTLIEWQQLDHPAAWKYNPRFRRELEAVEAGVIAAQLRVEEDPQGALDALVRLRHQVQTIFP